MSASPVYVSNNVPFGGFYAYLYRNMGTIAAPSFEQIGQYLMESMTPSPGTVRILRPDEIGGDNGWAIVNGIVEGPAVFQLAVTATPTLANGDVFKTSKVFFDVNGSGVAGYFVVTSPAPAIGTTEYKKQSCTLIQDRFPSAAVQAIAESP